MSPSDRMKAAHQFIGGRSAADQESPVKQAFLYLVQITNTPRLRPPVGGRIHPSQEGIF